MKAVPPNSRFNPGDDLAPQFEIEIDEVPKSFEAIKHLIASLTWEEDEEMATQAEIMVINQPSDTPEQPPDWTQVIDNKAFQEGNTLDVWIGYAGIRYHMGRVDIVRWLPIFPENGPGTFTIKGYDGRHRMTIGNERKSKKTSKKRTYYRNMPDEEIVKKIAAKYGYGSVVDSTDIKKHVRVGSGGKKKSVLPTRVHTADTTDWEFLKKLAEINRFDLWVQWNVTKKRYDVHFKKKKDAGDAEYVFTYNGGDYSLLSAEPDFSAPEQVTDVEVLVYDRNKRKIERTIIEDINPAENVKLKTAKPTDWKATKTLSVGARVRFSAFGQVFEAFSDKPFRSKKEAASFVQQWLKEREKDLIVLRAKVVGVESLRPRQIHQFVGLGERIDGFYRLSQVRHELNPDKAYTCQILANKVLSQEITRRKATTKATT